MVVAFDATVLSGAFLSPRGPNFRLLRLAASGGPLRGFTSDVAGQEFRRHALGATWERVYEEEIVDEFLETFAPLFDIDNVVAAPIGRPGLALGEWTYLHGRPLGEVVYELTGRSRPDLLENIDAQPTVQENGFDPNDVHLVCAAAIADANAICTNDSGYTFDRIGSIQIVNPVSLALEFDLIPQPTAAEVIDE